MGEAGVPPLPTGSASSAVTPGRVPPQIGSLAPPRLRFRVRAGYVVLGLLLCLLLLGAIGITGCFRLSPATRALRAGVIESLPGQCEKRLAVHVGGLTLGLARFGSRFFNLPPEPKAALAALHGAEVGVYELRHAPSALDYSAVFTAADKSMRRRGWERIVGVIQGSQLVAVYTPRDLRAPERMACCILVLNERKLVVAAARGNLEPLLEVARQRLPGHQAALNQVMGDPRWR